MSTLTATGSTRDAVLDDVPALAALGLSFVASSPYEGMPGVTHDSIAAALRAVIERGGFVRVAEVGGAVVGMLVAGTGVWFAPEAPIAGELAWWVEPEHRKTAVGFRLIRDYVKWARDLGMWGAHASDMDKGTGASAGDVLQALGFHANETSWLRRFV